MSFFFFKQKTAYEMRISDWSSDVCSSDLIVDDAQQVGAGVMNDGRVVLVPAIAQGPEMLVAQQLREAEDSVQGRAELMAHLCEEGGLGPAGRLGLLEAPGQLFFGLLQEVDGIVQLRRPLLNLRFHMGSRSALCLIHQPQPDQIAQAAG